MNNKIKDYILSDSSVLVIGNCCESIVDSFHAMNCTVKTVKWFDQMQTDQQFDTVLYYDSYEQIKNTKKLMNSISSALRENGNILIVLEDRNYTQKKMYRIQLNSSSDISSSHELHVLFETKEIKIYEKNYYFENDVFHYLIALKKSEHECPVIDTLPDDILCTEEAAIISKLLDEKNKQIKFLEKEHQDAYDRFIEVNEKLVDVVRDFLDISNSKSWKITAPLRFVMNSFKKFLDTHPACKKYLKITLKQGVQAGWTAFKKDKMLYPGFQGGLSPLYSKKQLNEQRQAQFSENVKFSILVPLYNTPKKYLHEMIQSVLQQTYQNWELCLADGSDENHSNVGAICQQYRKKDARIQYKKLEKNLGISGNTNECIKMASGDYISLFDHDDLLHPSALFMKMKAICDQKADFIYTDENTFHHVPKDAFCPHFKPDYAPDTLRANNYICHFTSFKRTLLEKAGMFRPECDGSQDFDMMLRLTEQAEKIVHIPEILYFWRAHANSVAESVGAKPYVIEAAKKAVGDHLSRVGLKGTVLDSVVPSMYRLHYELESKPLVSILIPNYENLSVLKTCIDSIYKKTTYSNFEIIIIENNSRSKDLFEYYHTLQKEHDNCKVIVWHGHFNYSAINNYGAQFASGEHLLLLNNDTEIITPEWIEEMLMYSQRSDVGIVGAKLYYPDDTVQHAGLGLGIKTLAGHLHRYFDRQHPGYMGRLIYAQNLTGVTFACVMMKRSIWDQMNGLDVNYEVTFNDVDMCLRVRKAGYLNVWTPFAELYHYESKSRGDDDSEKKKARFRKEVLQFQDYWKEELAAGDPYLNPNFSLDHEDFRIKPR